MVSLWGNCKNFWPPDTEYSKTSPAATYNVLEAVKTNDLYIKAISYIFSSFLYTVTY